jgi:hypothetical protein
MPTRRAQAEAFVQAVAEATGRLPVVCVHPTWANGDPLPGSGLSLGARITPDSILALCSLWVADYHDSPEVPLAWAASGWRLWQYAGDESAGRPAYGQTSIVRGVSRCDRNLFNGAPSVLERSRLSYCVIPKRTRVKAILDLPAVVVALDSRHGLSLMEANSFARSTN